MTNAIHYVRRHALSTELLPMPFESRSNAPYPSINRVKRFGSRLLEPCGGLGDPIGELNVGLGDLRDCETIGDADETSEPPWRL